MQYQNEYYFLLSLTERKRYQPPFFKKAISVIALEFFIYCFL